MGLSEPTHRPLHPLCLCPSTAPCWGTPSPLGVQAPPHPLLGHTETSPPLVPWLCPLLGHTDPPLYQPRPCWDTLTPAPPLSPGTAVALKLMPKERSERRAFLREYCIALCLSAHAGFLRTLPIAFESPTHFAFAQELAPAGDLCAIGLPEAQVKRCAAQLAEALDFMHGKALVHRDIKLDNVLLFDSECRRVKLGDFGLTRLEGTPVCAMSGTLPYAPPELCLLEASETLELDASLDAWAFGVLLFCLGTGCFPWDVAVSPDPQFEAFGAWQNSTVPGEAPAPWRAFSTAAQEMFRRLLTLDPNRRSPAIEVHKYLPRVWLTSSLRELDAQPPPPRAPPRLGGGRPQSKLGKEVGGGEEGGASRSGGGGEPAPPAIASIPCHPSVSSAPIPIKLHLPQPDRPTGWAQGVCFPLTAPAPAGWAKEPLPTSTVSHGR
uniref:SH3 domain binding kinase family member 3 n=1 Tax=Chelydra serpentina TaxID=8475 RepID=A0A8C3S8M3_CHESE